MAILPTFDIFGGCTSRDLFNQDNAAGVIGAYFARSSLASQYSRPVPIPKHIEAIEPVNFTTRCVKNDFRNGFKNHIRSSQTKSEYLIIDLLVERLRLCRWLNNGIITYSNELRKIKGNFVAGKRVAPEEHAFLFRKLVPVLAEDLKVYKKVFINRALLSTVYLNSKNEIVKFENQEQVRKLNAFLIPMYDLLEKKVSNAVLIEPSRAHAWEQHRWGLAEYHYEDRYYREINEKVRASI